MCVCVCECRFLNAQEFSIRLRLTQFQIGSKIYLNFHGQILHNCIKEEIFDFTVLAVLILQWADYYTGPQSFKMTFSCCMNNFGDFYLIMIDWFIKLSV